MKVNYNKLCRLQERIYKLSHAKSILSWDQATNMSPDGNDARSKSIAEISSLIHEFSTEKCLKKLIIGSENEDLNEIESSNLHEIKRNWLRKNVIPNSLVVAKQVAQSKCEFLWRSQRNNNDWNGFLDNFNEVVKLSQEEAKILSDNFDVTPYEAMMDKFEPDLKVDDVDTQFNQIKTWLPDLISKVCQKQRVNKTLPITHTFDIDKQKKLCVEIMELLGFNFQKGRLDESIHPFCGGVKEDIRVTTRFNNSSFLQSLFGAIHETGHARYEQNLPKFFKEQPVSSSRSMSIHESQSLFFEKQVGCNPNFIKRIAPIIQKHFGNYPELDVLNLFTLINTVKPGFIRVDADEVTYPAHILVRYEIEKDLINREIKTSDIPSLWDEKMDQYLGVNTKGNFKDGVLQDIHWPGGQFGYFPCYTIGAMYAAQWFHYAKKSVENIDELLLKGNLEEIFKWLKKNVWEKGCIYETSKLTEMACEGEGLNANYLKNHLEERYLA